MESLFDRSGAWAIVLTRRFGDAYRDYKERVPRWV
jgi:protein-S-isoprenylcysteine O-methyltransferase Ste14